MYHEITVTESDHQENVYKVTLRHQGPFSTATVVELTQDNLRDLFHAINDASGGALVQELLDS